MPQEGGLEPESDGLQTGAPLVQGTWFLLRLIREVRELRFKHWVHSHRDKFLARETERIEQLVDRGTMSRDRATQVLANREAKAASTPPALPSAEEVAAADFVERLLQRQASRPPDFAALYQRQKELDGAGGEGTKKPER